MDLNNDQMPAGLAALTAENERMNAWIAEAMTTLQAQKAELDGYAQDVRARDIQIGQLQEIHRSRNAEIARLRAELAKPSMEHMKQVPVLRALLLETATMLDKYTPDFEGGYREAKELVHRAREASKNDMRKLIQITSSTAPDGDGATAIFVLGLCDDGTAWELYMGDQACWTPLPAVPQDAPPVQQTP